MNTFSRVALVSSLVLLVWFGAQSGQRVNSTSAGIIDSKGATLEERFHAPPGYSRMVVSPNGFASYLRRLPLKPAGSYVKYYDGQTKYNMVYDAVVDLDIGDRDLQQCADAVMRLRAEYFYSQKMFDSISFTLTNGFNMAYAQWMKGNRLAVQGNKTRWEKKQGPSNTYKDFRNYLDVVFNYAGTLSLSKMLHPKNPAFIAPGDVFIVGGSPGHAVIVTDVAVNKEGERLFMLAQSYMPAQDIQVLKNEGNPTISPWYKLKHPGPLHTPQWNFESGQLKTW